MVELRPFDRRVFGSAGAFTNIVTWAADSSEFRTKAETIAATMHLFVVDIEDAEPLAERTKRCSVDDQIEDMARRAESNPNAIVYGTFHCYERDGA